LLVLEKRHKSQTRKWVGFFSLDFLWFFLVSRQERTLSMLFAKFCSRLFVSNLFRPFRACKIIRPIQGAAPLATYYAPSGLFFTRSPGTSFQNYYAPSGLVKIVRSVQGAAPLATYYAPSGLLFTRSPGTSFQNYSAPSGLKSDSRRTDLNPEPVEG